jgi:hypothetical protein
MLTVTVRGVTVTGRSVKEVQALLASAMPYYTRAAVIEKGEYEQEYIAITGQRLRITKAESKKGLAREAIAKARIEAMKGNKSND